MKDKNILEFLLGTTAELLNAIKLHQGPIEKNLTPQVMEDLEKLEQAMAEFEAINQQTFQKANVDIERMKAEAIGSEKISPKYSQIIRKAREIERDAKNLKMQYEQLIAQTSHLKAKKDKKAGSNRKEIKNRRNRYKPMGGDKKWLPI